MDTGGDLVFTPIPLPTLPYCRHYFVVPKNKSKTVIALKKEKEKALRNATGVGQGGTASLGTLTPSTDADLDTLMYGSGMMVVNGVLPATLLSLLLLLLLLLLVTTTVTTTTATTATTAATTTTTTTTTTSFYTTNTIETLYILVRILLLLPNLLTLLKHSTFW